MPQAPRPCLPGHTLPQLELSPPLAQASIPPYPRPPHVLDFSGSLASSVCPTHSLQADAPMTPSSPWAVPPLPRAFRSSTPQPLPQSPPGGPAWLPPLTWLSPR